MNQQSSERRKTKLIVSLLIVSTFLLSSCDFIKNAFTYKDKTKELVETVLNEDYDKAFDQLAMDHEIAKDADREVIKNGFINFRETLISNFGKDLDYRFVKSEKTWSTDSTESTAPNTTLALIEFSNETELGVLKVKFDDVSGKILSINMLNTRQAIPKMTTFWLFGVLALGVLAFNIVAIRLVKRSNLKRKWLKYLGIILLNAPTFSYAAIGGLSFKLLHFQFLFGISFGYLGYSGSLWELGVPLGGLYWFLKLRKQNQQPLPEPTNVEIPEANSHSGDSESLPQ
jgi:hypothetical protein